MMTFNGVRGCERSGETVFSAAEGNIYCSGGVGKEVILLMPSDIVE